MPAGQQIRYTMVAIALHWAMAALLLFMIWLGWNMDDHEARYQLHKSVGITLLFLTLFRIGWRLVNLPPPLPGGMKPLEMRLAGLVQTLFYVLMLVLPLSGWLLVSVSPFQVATVLYGSLDWPNLPFLEGLRGDSGKLLRGVIENIHSKGAWVLIVLLGLHVAGAIRHQMSPHGGVIGRMFPSPNRQTVRPARGLVIVAAPVLAVFALIALIGSGGPGRAQQSPPAPLAEGNWIVDHAVSQIRFEGTHDGSAFDGVFGEWDAVINFSEDALEDASAFVRIQTGSARTGTRLYDSTLREREWFDTATYPEAQVRLTGFRETGPGEYIADAAITIKQREISIPLSFALVVGAETASLSADVTLSRRALDLGQISDPDAAWVSDEIRVRISGEARRRD